MSKKSKKDCCGSVYICYIMALMKMLEEILLRLLSKIKTPDEFGMDPALVKMLRHIFQFLYDSWWNVKVTGIKYIPKSGPAIIAANHSGMLPYDAAMLNMAVFSHHSHSRNVRFLVADFVEHFPVISRLIKKAGGVTASPENAEKLLQKKELVCIFPEGTRGIGKLYCERYKLQPFGHGGLVKLAIKEKVPVIPCAIIGAEEIHPILWKSEELGKKLGLPFFPVTPTFPALGIFGLIPLPSQWKIIFGKPVYFHKSARKHISGSTEHLRKTIQKMIDDNLT